MASLSSTLDYWISNDICISSTKCWSPSIIWRLCQMTKKWKYSLPLNKITYYHKHEWHQSIWLIIIMEYSLISVKKPNPESRFVVMWSSSKLECLWLDVLLNNRYKTKRIHCHFPTLDNVSVSPVRVRTLA